MLISVAIIKIDDKFPRTEVLSIIFSQLFLVYFYSIFNYLSYFFKKSNKKLSTNTPYDKNKFLYIFILSFQI